MRRAATFALSLALLSAGSTGRPQEAADLPDTFTNLQVLPKDITKQQMLDLMKGMGRSLGVDCEHCHAVKNDDLDFASDDKRQKKAARVMIHMTNDINQKLRAVTTETRVSCWTCHRGEAKPDPTPAAATKAGSRP